MIMKKHVFINFNDKNVGFARATREIFNNSIKNRYGKI